jgi:hypothetical protein
MNENEVAKLLAIAMPYYQTFKPTKNEMIVVVKAWARQVGHLDYSTGEAAMVDACSRCKFFPTPADVLESVEKITTTPYMTGAEAWAMVMADVRRGVGYPYAGEAINAPQTRITDKTILRCVEAVGGWRGLQVSTSEQDISNRSQFIRAYESISKTQRDYDRMLPQVKSVREIIQSTVRQLEGPK